MAALVGTTNKYMSTILTQFCATEGVPKPVRVQRYRRVITAHLHGHALASPDAFRGAPRQDVVLIENDGDEPWVGRLLAAFSFSSGGRITEAAIVHYFDNQKDATVKGLRNVRALTSRAVNIIPASSVLCRALLHPHPTRANTFLLNNVVVR
jgi:hypothetical protein